MGIFIKDNQELRAIIEGLKCQGKKIVFTNGCFDFLHIGHARYLAEAKKLGDILVVALNDDQSVKRIKGAGRPITPLAERAELIAALKMVDFACSFEEDTPLKIITLLAPDVLVKGGDWALDEVIGREFVESYGGKTVVIPVVDTRSTTQIIEKIKDSRVPGK